MSDLFGNHIVGFPTRRLKCVSCAMHLKNGGPVTHILKIRSIFLTEQIIPHFVLLSQFPDVY